VNPQINLNGAKKGADEPIAAAATWPTPPPRTQPAPQPTWQAPLASHVEVWPAQTAAAAPSYGQRLALAIASLLFFVPLAGIALGAAVVFDVGFGGWLIGLAITGLVVALVNLIFNLGAKTPRR
jgi:hypothetical protein